MNTLKRLYEETKLWVSEILFIWFQLAAFIVGVAIVFAPIWGVLYLISLFIEGSGQ